MKNRSYVFVVWMMFLGVMSAGIFSMPESAAGEMSPPDTDPLEEQRGVTDVEATLTLEPMPHAEELKEMMKRDDYGEKDEIIEELEEIVNDYTYMINKLDEPTLNYNLRVRVRDLRNARNKLERRLRTLRNTAKAEWEEDKNAFDQTIAGII